LKQMRRLMGIPSIDLVCSTSLGAPHSGHFICLDSLCLVGSCCYRVGMLLLALSFGVLLRRVVWCSRTSIGCWDAAYALPRRWVLQGSTVHLFGAGHRQDVDTQSGRNGCPRISFWVSP
jgi:hypothetical protein